MVVDNSVQLRRGEHQAARQTNNSTVMGIPKESLEKKLKEELETVHLEVEDLSDGCGAKFQVFIVSPKFEGVKPTIKRHRMVHGAIEEEMKAIHAIQLKTLTPGEWEQLKQS
ncbi:hypothetical protein BaRGS_00000697 [Batillaria attramentaria]|uniref:Bola-like protein n=1 Tax=Batillaria attramentaria TaxID=370345 RepID=A0ABD0M8N5_9CAEN